MSKLKTNICPNIRWYHMPKQNQVTEMTLSADCFIINQFANTYISY